MQLFRKALDMTKAEIYQFIAKQKLGVPGTRFWRFEICLSDARFIRQPQSKLTQGNFFKGPGQAKAMMLSMISGMARRGANSNWVSGVPVLLRPAGPTEFEVHARRLGLTEETYVTSPELRKWCEENRFRCYVPEWLLAEWRLRMESTFSEQAVRYVTAVSVEIHHTGSDPGQRTEISAHIEHALADRPGDWKVSIIGSEANDRWEMKIAGPNAFERTYTLEGTAGERRAQTIGALWTKMVPR